MTALLAVISMLIALYGTRNYRKTTGNNISSETDLTNHVVHSEEAKQEDLILVTAPCTSILPAQA